MRPAHRRWLAIFPILMMCAASLVRVTALFGQSDSSRTSSEPPWKRQLSGGAASLVVDLGRQYSSLASEGRFKEAAEIAREVAEIRTRLQGADHWETGDARHIADGLRSIAALPDEGRRAMSGVGELKKLVGEANQCGSYAEAERLDRRLLEIRVRWLGEDNFVTAMSYDSLGVDRSHQGNYADAESSFRKALAIRMKVLGENHPNTAWSYNNLALTLSKQGKYAQAEPLHRDALAISLRVLGQDDPATANCYEGLESSLRKQARYVEGEPFLRTALAVRLRRQGANDPHTAMTYIWLALNLDGQGKHVEAEPLLRKSLAINLKALGEDHLNTAMSYIHLSDNLIFQGKFAEAEPLIRKSLAIRVKALGEEHPDTLDSYNGLAGIMLHQGKFAEAESLDRKLLTLSLKALGEEDPRTVKIYNNFAGTLEAQGKYAEAESLLRKSLFVWLKTHGEDPNTSILCRNLAVTLNLQGKYAGAEALCRRALAIRLNTLGEEHRLTAENYTTLANSLDQQGKDAEAETLHRKALAIWLKTLGEDHPDTASGYSYLAYNLDAQGKLPEAVASWTAAAAIDERTRNARSASGLERSLSTKYMPFGELTVALARQGQTREAWDRWEASMARGLLDDLSARFLRPLKADQRRHEADLAGQLQGLDERIARLAGEVKPTEAESKQIDGLRIQQSVLRGQWVELQNALDQEYQAYVGKPSTLEEVQKGLRGDAALVGWLDVRNHHWACTVRREGDPIWMKTSGSGNGGAWTKDDDENPRKLRHALAGHQPAWGPAAEAPGPPAAWRPLLPQLKGVRQLIVLPSQALMGVPIEALVASLPTDSPRPVISYAPSGSMLARLAAPRLQPPGPRRLLALGDPTFPAPTPNEPAPAPPDHGIAIVAVTPNSIADLFGIRPGDVLLEYNGKALKSQSDLAVIPAGDKAVGRFRLNSGVTATFAPWKSPRDNWASSPPQTVPLPRLSWRNAPPPRCSGPASARRAFIPSRGPAARLSRSPHCSPRIRSRFCSVSRPPNRSCKGWRNRARLSVIASSIWPPTARPTPAWRSARPSSWPASPIDRRGRPTRPRLSRRPTARSPPSRSCAPGTSTPTSSCCRPARAGWAATSAAKAIWDSRRPYSSRGRGASS